MNNTFFNKRFAVYDEKGQLVKIFEDREDAWNFIDTHTGYTWAVYVEDN